MKTGISTVPELIDDLKPHPRNFRAHPQDQLDEIAASITEHGFYRPVVRSSDGYILAGHGLVEAAKRLGYDTVPVHPLDATHDDPKALKVLVGDNELSRLAADDDDALLSLLCTIAAEDDLRGTGYDDAALAALSAMVNAQPSVPEPGEQNEPMLRAERYVEILCSSTDLAQFQPTLEEWSARRGVEINIS